nr:DUF58 domain-containing protein [Eubacterium sp.]
MKAKIFYAIWLVVAALLYVCTNAQTTLFFLVPMIVLVPVVVVMNRIAAGKTSIEVRVMPEEGHASEGHIALEMCAKNDSILPIFRVCITGAVKNLLTRTEQDVTWETSIPPKGLRTKTIDMESRYCGKMEGEILEAKVHDFLGISSRNIGYRSMGECYVYPTDTTQGEVPVKQHLQDEVNVQNRYLNRRGNDITQILDIRDYQKGDNIKSIHWKMSRKLGRKVIRELDMPANQDTIVFLAISPEELDNPAMRDRVARAMLGVSEELLQEQINHDAVLFSEEGNVRGTYSIEGPETRDWCEHILLDGDISFDSKNMLHYIHNHNVLGKYSAVIVVADAKLEIGEEYPNVIQIVAQ